MTEKLVDVCAYTRRRYGRIEFVCKHLRSMPSH